MWCVRDDVRRHLVRVKSSIRNPDRRVAPEMHEKLQVAIDKPVPLDGRVLRGRDAAWHSRCYQEGSSLGHAPLTLMRKAREVTRD